MKPVKRYLTRWFVTRPALRFGLAVAGVLWGCYVPELFWPGVALLAAGALLHLWAKGCLRQYEVLTICGPYRFVRHPFYLSYLVIDAGLCLMIANLYVAAVYFPVWLVVYYLQIRREEFNLLALFGGKYANYRRRVPSLLPCGLPAPCAGGQSFSWSNPNLTRRSEIPRLLRLADFPLFFFLAYRIRDGGVDYFNTAGSADAFAISALFAVFFFAKLLNPAVKRRRRMLPEWLEAQAFMAIVQLAVLIIAVLLGIPHAWGSWLLWIAMALAAAAVLSVFAGPLKRAYFPLILGSSAIAIAWQMYWLVPVVAFYYGACAVDRALFLKK
jgi:protein-S-isoprenylcysteine O-methyltransferase Ste14